MGLDNDISIRRTEFSSSFPWIRSKEFTWDKDHEFDYAICYWRKCWNVRNMIMSICNITKNNDSESETELSLTDLINIRKGLKKYNKRTWDIGMGYWEWSEIRSTIKHQIFDLKRLIRYKKKYGNRISIYFYDNY